MTLDLWLVYLAVVLAVIVSPGPSALLCISHGVAHGSARTLATIAGGIVASLTLMGLSSVGLGAAIAASDTLFQVIKWAGALYLVLLGLSMWRAPKKPADSVSAATTRGTPGQLFRSGFAVGISNPKDLLFFSALFPQFLDPSAALLPQLMVLAATWLVIDGVAMLAYAWCGARVAGRLSRLGAGRLFNRLTGGVFIGAGAALATVHR